MDGQCLGEARDVRPGWRIGHADDPRPMGAQHRLEIEIAGIVHQHRVAGRQQEPAKQVHGPRARRRKQDLVRPRLDPLGRELAREQPAQGERSARGAIIGQHGAVRAGERTDRPADRGFGHPVGRQPAAARPQDFRRSIERLAGHPQGINGAVELRRHVPQRARRHGPRDVEAGTGTRADQPFRREPVVRLHDGRGRDLHVAGELTDRGQFFARRQGPARHAAADLGHDRNRPRRAPALRSGTRLRRGAILPAGILPARIFLAGVARPCAVRLIVRQVYGLRHPYCSAQPYGCVAVTAIPAALSRRERRGT